MNQDLTRGRVGRQLLRFAFPLFLANLLQSTYSIVDMVVVGHFVGPIGLGAISSAVMMGFIIQSICMGFTVGGAVLVAQYKGAGDRKGQGETVGTLFSLSLMAALLVTGLSLYTYHPVLDFMQVPAQALPQAQAYLQVICWGTIFVFGYNAVCSVMRGLGDSQSPLLFVALATVLNIGLDLLFVGLGGWGTRGAALATVISQGLSWIMAGIYLYGRDLGFALTWQNFIPKGDKGKIILKLGFPTAIQMTVLNFSYLLVTGMFNVHGLTVAAAAGVGLKVNTFTAMPCWAVGQGVMTCLLYTSRCV